MPHSLRVKIKKLRYKGIITDKDCYRLCKALDNEKVLDKIRAEIEQTADEEQKHDEKWAIGLRYAVKIIDKYAEQQKCNTCYHNTEEFSVCQYCTDGNKYEERYCNR